MPGTKRLEDLGGAAQGRVDLALDGFGGGGLAYLEGRAIAGGQGYSDELMGAQLLAPGPPRGVKAAVEAAALDTEQQVVGEHAEEDIGWGTVLELVEDRPFYQRTLEAAEGGLNAGKQTADAPDLFDAKIVAVGFEQIGAVQLLGAGLFGAVLLPPQLRPLRVIVDAIITCDPRITLAQAAAGLLD
jgi:hypothetical protein